MPWPVSPRRRLRRRVERSPRAKCMRAPSTAQRRSVSSGADRVTELRERRREHARDLHLRKTDLVRDALLAQVAVVAERDDPPLAATEGAKPRVDEGARLAPLELGRRPSVGDPVDDRRVATRAATVGRAGSVPRTWRRSSPTIVGDGVRAEIAPTLLGGEPSTALINPIDATCTRSSSGSPGRENRLEPARARSGRSARSLAARASRSPPWWYAASSAAVASCFACLSPELKIHPDPQRDLTSDHNASFSMRSTNEMQNDE